MQKLMPLVAALAATVMYGCGSPTPPGGGGDRIRIACPGAGADCGVLRIDSDRDNVELTVVRDDVAPGIYQVLKHQAPQAHETWDANLVVEDYPTRYLACAFLTEDNFICRRETLMPGEVKESHCYFEDEGQKAMVTVHGRGAKPSARVTVDGNVTTVAPEGSTEVVVGVAHELTFSEPTQTCRVKTIRPETTSPLETSIACGDNDPIGWRCDAVEGWPVGEPTTPPLEFNTSGTDLDFVLLVGLWGEPVPVVGDTIGGIYDDVRYTGTIDKVRRRIEYTTTEEDGRLFTVVADCHP